MKLNLGCGAYPLNGFANLDAATGWRFEHGLSDYPTGSVDAITISHALMYVRPKYWPAMFAEFARVLRDGGVIRVTEDNTADTRSRTHGTGWRGSQPAITLTDAGMVKAHMLDAGLVAHDVDPWQTHYRDDTLIQRRHDDPPHVFHVEGIRMTRVLFEPHSDDAALFAAFTVLEYRPRIVTCFGSAGDYGSTEERAAETADAMSVLGAKFCEQWAGGDLVAQMRELDERVKPSLVFAPSAQASHAEHVAVSLAARFVFGDRLRCYHTYDAGGKVRDGTAAPFRPEWIQAKLRALARYPSQIKHPRAHVFFLDDLREYLE